MGFFDSLSVANDDYRASNPDSFVYEAQQTEIIESQYNSAIAIAKEKSEQILESAQDRKERRERRRKQKAFDDKMTAADNRMKLHERVSELIEQIVDADMALTSAKVDTPEYRAKKALLEDLKADYKSLTGREYA